MRNFKSEAEPSRTLDPSSLVADRDRENSTKGESFQGRNAGMPTNPESE